MGGGRDPGPMAGKLLNEQMVAESRLRSKNRLAALNSQSDEMFQTLLSSGQKPYRSPYEPEDLNAPMSNQNPGPVDFRKFFDANRFS